MHVIHDAGEDGLEVGQEVQVDVFATGEICDLTGMSKGKGCQGVIKRHVKSSRPSSHGAPYDRLPGSRDPIHLDRVFMSKKSRGRLVYDHVTIHNLELV
ncbi:50S ribosomal protein L3, partial [Bacillus sp. S1-R4H1-FB]|uniref:50S ribosomal protein L3 n=1 Tax=Bacillus sp. S1-R4H1-FB TaxID=1973492 RepID=UPI00112464A5